MIHLVNGRGQLGQQLKKYVGGRQTNEEVYVYHTWSVQNKTEEEQKKEYKKLQSFVDEHSAQKIIFVSTKSQRETWYTRYKQLAEAYVLLHCKDSLVIRFPTFVGNGIIEKFQKGEATPYGEMELITVDTAARAVIESCFYDGIRRSFTIDGDRIPAELVYNLVKREKSV